MKQLPVFIRISILAVSLLFAGTSAATDKKESANPVTKIESLQSNDLVTKKITFTKELTFKEKIKLVREIKRELKREKKNVAGETPKVILYILAVLIPPVAVGIYTNWGIPTLWNLLFTLCFWLPGIVHAFYVLLR